MANGWRPSIDTVWLFLGQAAVALVVAGMIYSRFTTVESAVAATATLAQENRERILVLETQFAYISQKLTEIAQDVKALRHQP